MKFTVELKGHTLAPEETEKELVNLFRDNGYTYVTVEHEQIDMLSLSFYAPEPDMATIHQLMENIAVNLTDRFNISLRSSGINNDPDDREAQLMGSEGYCQFSDNRLLFCQHSSIARLIEQLKYATPETRFCDLSDIPDCRSIRFVQELAGILGIKEEQPDAARLLSTFTKAKNPVAEMIGDLLRAPANKAFN